MDDFIYLYCSVCGTAHSQHRESTNKKPTCHPKHGVLLSRFEDTLKGYMESLVKLNKEIQKEIGVK